MKITARAKSLTFVCVVVAPQSPSDYTESEIRAVRDEQYEKAPRGSNDDDNIRTPPRYPWFDSSDDDDIRTPTYSPIREDLEESEERRTSVPASPPNHNYFDKSDDEDIRTPAYSPIREDIQGNEPDNHAAHSPRSVTLPTPTTLAPSAESLVRPLSAFRIDVAKSTGPIERNLGVSAPISRFRRQERRAPLVDPGFSEYRARNIYRVANQKQKPRRRKRLYKCGLCKVTVTSSDQLAIHLNSGKHARREQAKKDLEANLYCAICDHKFTKSVDFKQHIDSIGHNNKAKRARTAKRRAVSHNKN